MAGKVLSFLKIKRIFQLRDVSPLERDRWFIVFAIVTTLCTGWFLGLSKQHLYDPFELRITVVGILVFFLTISFFQIERLIKSSDLTLIGACIIITHVLYLIPKNNFSFIYSMSGVVGLNLILTFSTSKRNLLILSSWIFINTLICIHKAHLGEVDPIFFAFCVTSGCSASLLIQLTRFSIDKQLKEVESQNTLIINNIHEGIIFRDQEGKIISFNPMFCEVMGLTEENVKGLEPLDPRWKCLREDGSPYPEEEYPDRLALKTGRFITNQILQIVKKDGNITWISISSIPIFEPGKTLPTRVISSLTDVTEVRKTQQQILEQQTQLIQSSRMSALGIMASGIAHEINNPLAIIKGKATKLKNLTESEKFDQNIFRSDLQTIDFTTDRIAKIIRGLRTFSRSSEQDHFESESVEHLISQTLSLCQERFNKNQVTIRIQHLSEARIHCRPAQILQVLLNLLNNAFDAVQDLPEKWVELNTEITPSKRILISVKDSGKGIPNSIAERLMTPFFTTKEPGKGTGLGLSISKGIIEGHNGTLLLDQSKSNTCFVIDLPLPQSLD